MKIHILVLVSLILPEVCNCQNIKDVPKAYFDFIKKADSLFSIKKYGEAAAVYSRAFEATGGQGKVKDRYSAASCWALADNPDSAFYQLFRIAINGKYTKYEEIEKDPNLLSLHDDKRWESLIGIMKKTRQEIEDKIEPGF